MSGDEEDVSLPTSPMSAPSSAEPESTVFEPESATVEVESAADGIESDRDEPASFIAAFGDGQNLAWRYRCICSYKLSRKIRDRVDT